VVIDFNVDNVKPLLTEGFGDALMLADGLKEVKYWRATGLLSAWEDVGTTTHFEAAILKKSQLFPKLDIGVEKRFRGCGGNGVGDNPEYDYEEDGYMEVAEPDPDASAWVDDMNFDDQQPETGAKTNLETASLLYDMVLTYDEDTETIELVGGSRRTVNVCSPMMAWMTGAGEAAIQQPGIHGHAARAAGKAAFADMHLDPRRYAREEGGGSSDSMASEEDEPHGGAERGDREESVVPAAEERPRVMGPQLKGALDAWRKEQAAATATATAATATATATGIPLCPEQKDFSKETNITGAVRTAWGWTIQNKDMATLSPGRWLSDEVMNPLMELLRRGEVEENPSTHFASTFFYSKLLGKSADGQRETGYDYTNVERWTSKKKGDNYTPSLCERMMVPLHLDGNHWALAVLHMWGQRVEYFDSLNSSDVHGVMDTLLRYVKDEFWSKRCISVDLSGWTKTVRTDTPRQGNYDDCGVHTWAMALAESVGGEKKTYTFGPGDMPNLRRHMVASILSGTIVVCPSALFTAATTAGGVARGGRCSARGGRGGGGVARGGRGGGGVARGGRGSAPGGLGSARGGFGSARGAKRGSARGGRGSARGGRGSARGGRGGGGVVRGGRGGGGVVRGGRGGGGVAALMGNEAAAAAADSYLAVGHTEHLKVRCA
jgi:hypothetical protein